MEKNEHKETGLGWAILSMALKELNSQWSGKGPLKGWLFMDRAGTSDSEYSPSLLELSLHSMWRWAMMGREAEFPLKLINTKWKRSVFHLRVTTSIAMGSILHWASCYCEVRERRGEGRKNLLLTLYLFAFYLISSSWTLNPNHVLEEHKCLVWSWYK